VWYRSEVFPDPLSRSELAALLWPILLRCDANGRRFVVELASAEVPDQGVISEEVRELALAAFWRELGKR